MSLIHVTDSEGMKPCIKLYQRALQIWPDLDLMIEEANSSITPQIQKAGHDRGTLRHLSIRMILKYGFFFFTT